MQNIYIILVKQFKVFLNKFIYANKENKKVQYTSMLFSVILISIIGLVLFAFISFLLLFIVSKAVNILLLMDTEEQIKYLSILILLFVFSNIYLNINSNVQRVLQDKDYLFLATLPITSFEYLTAKFSDRYIIKLALRYVFIIPFLLIVFIYYKLQLTTIIYIFIMLALLLFMSFIIRLHLLLLLFKAKLERRVSYTYIGITITFLFVSALSLLYLIFPFKHLIDNKFSVLVDKIIEIKMIQQSLNFLTSNKMLHYGISQSIFELQSKGSYPAVLMTILIVFITILLIIIYKRMIKKVSYSDLVNSLFKYQEVRDNKNLEPKLLKPILILSKIVPQTTGIIVKKDFKDFIRGSQYHWIYRIFIIIVEYTLIIFGVYLLNRFVESLTLDRSIVGFLLAVYGVNLVASNLIDRFGIDHEGENFIILKLSPVKPIQIISAKIYGLLIFSLPFSIIFSLLSLFIFKTKPILIMLTIILVVPAVSTINIAISTVFPNYKYESILDLPSTNARMLYTFLFTIYIGVTGLLVYYSNLWVFSLGFILINISIVSLFSYLACKKLEHSYMNSYESYGSAVE